MITETDTFDPKDPEEVLMVKFDFRNLTTAPSAPLVTVTRHSGSADSNPSDILVGDPEVMGTEVWQKVRNGVAGTVYALRCRVDAPSGLRYVIPARLPVETA